MAVSGLPPYDDGNIFARILRGEIPNKTVYEDQWALAFYDIGPQAPVHVLVIPRAHIPGIDVPEAAQGSVLSALVSAANTVARDEGIAESGFRLVWNVGPNAGQSVFHLHLHVLGGRPLGWPPG